MIQSELVFTEAEDNAEAEAPEQVDAFGDEAVLVAGHKRKKQYVINISLKANITTTLRVCYCDSNRILCTSSLI